MSVAIVVEISREGFVFLGVHTVFYNLSCSICQANTHLDNIQRRGRKRDRIG